MSLKGLNFFEPPTTDELDKLDPIYVSYFVQWNSFKNYEIAKRYGFHDLTHEWTRTHHIEQMDQVDSRTYLVHSWMKYPKFGHASATDYAARMVRYGMLSRDQAVRLIKEHDHALDPLCIRDFCASDIPSRSSGLSLINTIIGNCLNKTRPVTESCAN